MEKTETFLLRIQPKYFLKDFPRSTWRQHYPTPVHRRCDACCEITHPKSPSHHCYTLQPSAYNDSALTANSARFHAQRLTHKVVIFHWTHRLLSAFWQFVRSLWASLSPLRTAHQSVHSAQTNLLLPGVALLQSQFEVGDWLSVLPMKSTPRAEWRWYCPTKAFKRWAGPSSSPNVLLTDTPYIQWRGLTPFTGRCRSNRGEEQFLNTATAQEDALKPPRWLECHRDDRSLTHCRKYISINSHKLWCKLCKVTCIIDRPGIIKCPERVDHLLLI